MKNASMTLLAFGLLGGALSVLGGQGPSLSPPGSGPSRNNDDAQLTEINELVDSGDLAAARQKLAETIAARGENDQTLYLEARILFREKKHRESLKVLERCIALDHRDPEVYKLVAFNAIRLNRMDIAEQALKSAADLAPGDYLVFFHLGALYYMDSRFPSAQPPLEKSVDLNPNYVPSRLFLALTQEELGQEKAAVDNYLRAIELAERFGIPGEQPYHYLGRLLYRQNKLDESLPYLQKAVKANSRSCEALCLLSRVYSSLGRDSDTVDALKQCLAADANFPEAHYLLSRAYARQGRTDEAAKELSLFQKLKQTEQNRNDPRRNQRAIR